MNSRNLLFSPFIYLSLPRFVICELFTSWLHKFANSRFNNQKFVILSIKYECALKNSSNHRVVIRKWSLVICKGFFRMTTLWFDKFFWFAKLFNHGGLTTTSIWECTFNFLNSRLWRRIEDNNKFFYWPLETHIFDEILILWMQYLKLQL